MNDYQLRPNWKFYAWLGVIGIIIYLLVQVVPQTSESFFDSGSKKVIAKSKAEQISEDFALQQFKQLPESIHAVHQSDSMLYGYLSKEKQTDTYDKKYDSRFPTDTFQVTAAMPDGSQIFIYVHMQDAKVVGWNQYKEIHTTIPQATQISDAAMKYAVSQGFKANELSMTKADPETGRISYKVNGYTIGESQLMLAMRTEKTSDGALIIAEYKPGFTVPASYSSYVQVQQKLASFLSLLGSILLSFVLFVIAIVYAALYRKHSSFTRGIVLTLLFLVMYLANDFNLMDGLLASAGEDPNAMAYAAINVGITCVVTIVMGIAVYFSLVGGDALWNSMGKRMWPRMGEEGYGDHVWRSMWLGYLIAFLLLGLQTVIFIVLVNVTGAWSTSDVTQSPYNLGILWIFPMLAWCAAISEEALYRFFGIGLFKKWFNNTFVASLIPTIIWALGHVTYPIFPSTTRLLELTVIGLIFSFMFLRYGFLTVVFAHAVFDSIMMAISLIFTGTPGNIIMGIVYILLPIPIAWGLRYLHDKKKRTRPLIAAPPSTLQ
ncbi:CPBP family intramembrane glutamic endopeptidase [Paenibacillus sepulcri]|uniref:CPBP family intramembrane metalloprotease n=1 Tax=Paenibacillus sepulcri TaxID=359917 RepID=A0ABS7C2N0_9BACL|nr:CPBP family intramembrane metalloprotease [Paenibacillus sepulcri]